MWADALAGTLELPTREWLGELRRRLEKFRIDYGAFNLRQILASVESQRCTPQRPPWRLTLCAAHHVLSQVERGAIAESETVEELKCLLARAGIAYRSRDVVKAIDAAEVQRHRAA